MTHCVDNIRIAELRPEESARARNNGHMLAMSLALSVSRVFDTACSVFVVGFAGNGHFKMGRRPLSRRVAVASTSRMR